MFPTIIQVAPWTDDYLLALKRSIIISFPSSMSAVVSDAIDPDALYAIRRVGARRDDASYLGLTERK
jgi:hypothetical protein